MIRKLIRLHFNTPIHIGVAGSEYDHSAELLHSDTLYAAIIQAWQILGIEHPILSVAADETPATGFTLSSFFPFYASTDQLHYVYYFPVPKSLLKSPHEAVLEKKLKAVTWADLNIFSQLLRGESLDYAQCLVRDKFISMIDSPRSTNPNGFFGSHVITRSYVPREYEEDTDTQIFYLDRLSFESGSGLFGLVEIADETTYKKLMAALRYLQDEGLGTDRYLGNGLFTLGSDDQGKHLDDWPTELLTLPASEYSMNLSLFCPENQVQVQNMLQGESIRYELTKRGGWINQYPHLSKRKNAVYMFKEASILHHDASTTGKTVNLRPSILSDEPQHNIFRVGQSLFLPIKM